MLSGEVLINQRSVKSALKGVGRERAASGLAREQDSQQKRILSEAVSINKQSRGRVVQGKEEWIPECGLLGSPADSAP